MYGNVAKNTQICSLEQSETKKTPSFVCHFLQNTYFCMLILFTLFNQTNLTDFNADRR